MKGAAIIASCGLCWLTGVILGVWIGGVAGEIAFTVLAIIAVAFLYGYGVEDP